MKLHDGIDVFSPLQNAIVTIGTFDGVHIGHQKILKRIRNLAQEAGGESVMITFWPHPRFVLHPEDDSLKLITTFDEKAALLEENGIDHLVKVGFTREFSQQSSDEFTRNVLVKQINTKKLVIGYDHRFGKNREGSFDYLKANASSYGFTVEEISRQDIDDIGVSSTRIRNALLAGHVEEASAYLGRSYALQGNVVHGQALGRELGFPTANIEIPERYKLIPADGVYLVAASFNEQRYFGMLNIGWRPTVDDKKHTIEVHLFNYHGDLYDQHIRVDFLSHLRAEKKFDSLESLKTQLEEDKALAFKLLNL